MNVDKLSSKVCIRLLQRFGACLSDETYIKLLFRFRMGYKLDLSAPKTYNEKLQWLKLYDRQPRYAKLVDKYAVKEIVAQIIGPEFIIPTLGVWENPDSIDFSSLPSSFVLKTTHGGGNNGVIVCQDKMRADYDAITSRLKKAMRQDLYKSTREWPYRNVQPRIIAEQYMEDNDTGELRDYKFFCFDGEVKALFIATGRSRHDVKFDYYDENFNHLELVQEHPMSGLTLQKPQNFDLMKEIASKLSKGIPHVRIDLYECNGHVYFGEMTFYHHGGVTPFHPKEWDRIFGEWIKLPDSQI